MALLGNGYDYYLGYALGGGGAKGFAHLGVLTILEKCQLKPDIIVGTSAGALAGVLYADGYHPEEIADMFRKKAFKSFVEIALPKRGIFKNAGLYHFLQSNLRAKTFEDLHVPFRAVTTDWEKAQTVVFSEGDHLIDAVVASCTVPVVFYPHEIEGVPYVDGGLFKNLPVSVIRDQCKYVIGVNVATMQPTGDITNFKKTTERTFNLMSNSNTLIDRKLADILIEVERVEKYSMFNLSHITDIMQAGYHAAAIEMSQRDSWRIVTKCLKHNQRVERMKKHLGRLPLS